ncbi:MAG: M20/M25/M40 family metallo-hydrolase, partial [Anaerolineales bacterium]
MQLSDLSAWIEAQQDGFTARLAELVNLNTFTENIHGVDHAMDVFCRWAQDFGFAVEVINGRHRLIRASHRPAEATPILLIAHMDTVHPPEAGFLEYEPQADGFVRGPGVGDIKGGLLMGLWTQKALSEMGVPYDVSLVVSADEEKGSPTIQDWYLAGSNGAAYALGLEPGFPQGPLAMDTPMGVVRQRKGCGRIAFSLSGRAAHAGGDPQNGLSAIEAMAHRVLKIQALNDHNKGITTNVGVIQGGTAANTIPATASAEVDFRFLTQIDGEATRDTLTEIIHTTT